MSRILEKRDDHFDLCRTFLVVCMVISHAFQVYYVSDYNRHYTFFVLIGFVYITGFTVSAVNTKKMMINWYRTSMVLFKRSMKIFALFLVCNILIALIDAKRWNFIASHEVSNLLTTIMLGKNQHMVSFNVLIPIGFTFLLSILIMFLFRSTLSRLLLFLLLLMTHFLSYWLGILDNYGVSLSLVGGTGIIMGILATVLDWDKLTEQIIFRKGILTISYLFLVGYYISITFLGEETYSLFSYHFIPTLTLLFALYFSSVRFRLDQNGIIRMLNQTLGKNMLFAYLYHILVLRVSLVICKHDGHTLIETLILASLLLIFTVYSCHVLNNLTARSVVVRKAYSLIFK